MLAVSYHQLQDGPSCGPTAENIVGVSQVGRYACQATEHGRETSDYNRYGNSDDRIVEATSRGSVHGSDPVSDAEGGHSPGVAQAGARGTQPHSVRPEEAETRGDAGHHRTSGDRRMGGRVETRAVGNQAVRRPNGTPGQSAGTAIIHRGRTTDRSCCRYYR
uniref:Uncharacterized protein n=1 Tax=Cacopsylla melanoneura TaxID=428564 RepID=A0A8D8UV05_9HEMI